MRLWLHEWDTLFWFRHSRRAWWTGRVLRHPLHAIGMTLASSKRRPPPGRLGGFVRIGKSLKR